MAPAGPVEGVKRLAVEISARTEEKLRALGNQLEVTANHIVITALGLWLARTTGEERAIFALMREARRGSIAGAESIIGPLVNTVPLAVAMADTSTVGELLSQVRAEVRALREIEHCALAQIAEWTGLAIDWSGPPVVLNFQRAPLPEQLRAAGLSPARSDVSLVQEIDLPVLLNGYASPHLELEVIWRTNLVSDASARALARGLSATLRAIAGAPDRRVGEIEIWPAEEDAILAKSSCGPRFEVPEIAAQEFIERQIRTQPDTIALSQGERDFTYAQLDEISARIARELLGAGAAREIIAVVLPPSARSSARCLESCAPGRLFSCSIRHRRRPSAARCCNVYRSRAPSWMRLRTTRRAPRFGRVTPLPKSPDRKARVLQRRRFALMTWRISCTPPGIERAIGLFHINPEGDVAAESDHRQIARMRHIAVQIVS